MSDFHVASSAVLEVDTRRLPPRESFENTAEFDLDLNSAKAAIESLRAYTPIAK